jgi:hypothetical protein
MVFRFPLHTASVASVCLINMSFFTFDKLVVHVEKAVGSNPRGLYFFQEK